MINAMTIELTFRKIQNRKDTFLTENSLSKVIFNSKHQIK